MSNNEPRSSQEPSAPVVPLDEFPDPVAVYTVQNGEPVIERANHAYTSRFGEVETGRPIRDSWAAQGLEPLDITIEELCSALVAGKTLRTDVVYCREGVGSTAEDQRVVYKFRSVGGFEASQRYDGYFMFTPSPAGTTDSVEADRIASVISHDLRNPLDVAKARLRAARETGDEDHFDHLERAHDRMERIIQDVLTLARGESAISISDSVALETVATDAWATVDTGAASLTLDDDLPVIEADPDRLRRLFENLFRNSIEHGQPPRTGSEDSDPESAIEVCVGTLNDGFFVADTGPGIPPEERDHVFTPGYTSQDTGTGLGLTIVKQIAQAHGWTVSLASHTNGGARFEFHGLQHPAA